LRALVAELPGLAGAGMQYRHREVPPDMRVFVVRIAAI